MNRSILWAKDSVVWPCRPCIPGVGAQLALLLQGKSTPLSRAIPAPANAASIVGVEHATPVRGLDPVHAWQEREQGLHHQSSLFWGLHGFTQVPKRACTGPCPPESGWHHNLCAAHMPNAAFMTAGNHSTVPPVHLIKLILLQAQKPLHSLLRVALLDKRLSHQDGTTPCLLHECYMLWGEDTALSCHEEPSPLNLHEHKPPSTSISHIPSIQATTDT